MKLKLTKNKRQFRKVTVTKMHRKLSLKIGNFIKGLSLKATIQVSFWKIGRGEVTLRSI